MVGKYFRRYFRAFLVVGTLAIAAPRADAALSYISLYNNAQYEQTSVNAPASPFGYFFSMGGVFANAGDYNFAEAIYPGVASKPLPISGTSFGTQTSSLPTLADIHAQYPFGIYTMNVKNTVTQATQLVSTNYAADLFGNVPVYSPASFTILKNFNPAVANTLSFNAFVQTGPANASNIFFDLIDSQTRALMFDPGPLGASATSLVIPANTLAPNKSYYAELNFSNRVRGSNSGVDTYQGFDTRNYVLFTTVPEPASVAILAIAVTPLLIRRRRNRANANIHDVL